MMQLSSVLDRALELLGLKTIEDKSPSGLEINFIFLITGYGPFGSVIDNPSAELARTIQEHLLTVGKTSFGSSTQLPIEELQRWKRVAKATVRSKAKTDSIKGKGAQNDDERDNHEVDDHDTMVQAKFQIEFFNEDTETKCTMIVNCLVYTPTVLEVSTVAAQNYITRIMQQCKRTRSSNDVFIHLHIGIAEFENKFRLEARAYNEASFRCPDQLGFQPSKKPIDELKDIDHYYETKLKLSEIVNTLSHMDPVLPVSLSQNAGRHLCNYILYQSLGHTLQPDRCNESMFLHIPSFKTFAKEDQLVFLKRLIESIAIITALEKVKNDM
eukprot:g4116.t1